MNALRDHHPAVRKKTAVIKGCLTALLLVYLFISAYPVLAAEDQVEAPAQPGATGKKGSLNPFLGFLSFYQKHISPIDGDRCPSMPTCSAYSVRAIKKHGFFIGWMMTVDRLIHEGREEARISPLVFSGGKWKIYDPVEANDFWWYDDNTDETR